MRNNKKGFTLIELLAVIVILAVVALMGITAIGPVMANSRKAALKNDGLDLISSAKTAFQAEGLKSNPGFRSNDTVCLSYNWLASNGYAEVKDGYDGSVLITYNEGSYSYNYWIKNKEYGYANATESTGYDGAKEVSDETVNTSNISTCGAKADIVKCSATMEKAADGKVTFKDAKCAK